MGSGCEDVAALVSRALLVRQVREEPHGQSEAEQVRVGVQRVVGQGHAEMGLRPRVLHPHGAWAVVVQSDQRTTTSEERQQIARRQPRRGEAEGRHRERGQCAHSGRREGRRRSKRVRDGVRGDVERRGAEGGSR